MLFNSLSFLLFFPLTTIIYFLLPHRLRWLHLLICSCFFYAALIPAYLLVLLGIIIIDYTAGLLIAPARGGVRTALLIVSLAANLGVLGFFKYFDFASGNLHRVAQLIGWNYPIRHLGLLLPIGLSFHTFQSMAYAIEVYRGRQQPERHPGIYALYVMFYPQLVAGPIERPQHLLHQFRRRHYFNADRVMEGLRIILWGLFKKMVVADRLATVVDAIYAHPSQPGGAYLILATWLFAVQIYCDFSGYSDIAIGAARVLGIELVRNFDRPYASQSIPEFWRRWHISLSRWFRDYLYIPLGGNRVGLPRWCLNVLIVFLLSGWWHGANWTFAIWGLVHGIYVIASRVTEGWRERLASKFAINRHDALWQALRIFLTFNLVSFAWIFFRAPTLADAGAVLKRIIGRHFWTSPNIATGPVGFTAYTSAGLNITLLAVALLFGVEWVTSRPDRQLVARAPVWARWAAYYACIVLILWFGAFGGRTFIYFQF